jgi:hypothetical protein
MTENSSDHSEAVQRYIDATPESTFEFDRRSTDEDDPLFNGERIALDDSE